MYDAGTWTLRTVDGKTWEVLKCGAEKNRNGRFDRSYEK
jgi:hypothetical protein